MSKERAFTLMEMMVVLAIFSMVMGITYTALRLNDTYRDLVLIRIQLYRANKMAVDTIFGELERSAANRWTIQDSNPDTIRFQIPLINSINWTTYDIPWGARQSNTDYPNKYIRYSLNGTNLVREIVDVNWSIVGGTRQEIIASDISDIQWTTLNLNPNYIKINVSGQKKTATVRWTISATTESTVFLLN